MKNMFKESIQDEKIDNYILMEKHNFYRPTVSDRRKIKTAFKKINITVYGNGYDLIDDKTKENINNLDDIINEVKLYELKSHGKKTKYKIDKNFKNFSFGITENEMKNYYSLGNKYKIIFLNCKINKIKIMEFKSIAKYFHNVAYFFRIGNKEKPKEKSNNPFLNFIHV